jgi:Spy/CpxP family protein refolding chaperone
MTRPRPIRLAALAAALLLVATAHVARAEAEPGGDPDRAAHELAHTLQQQRQQIAEARALLADAAVSDRDAGAVADPLIASLDAFEAALVAEDLLAPDAMPAVAERGMALPQGAAAMLKARQPTAATAMKGSLQAPSKLKAPIKGLTGSPAQPAIAAKEKVAAVARLIGNGAPPELVKARWQQAVQGASPGTDANALVQHVLQQSLMETQRDLAFYADKVKYNNELKKIVREEITRLREQLAAAPATDRARLEAQVAAFEQRLQAIGDDAQLANVDLQNVLQKQQQALQAMSSTSKMLHDTAMATIRKLGG